MFTKEKFMLIDLIIANYSNYGDLEGDADSYIEKNEYVIIDDYIEADEKNVFLVNKKNVIEELLRDKYSTENESLESNDNVIASGSLKEISEKIVDYKIDFIMRKLSVYGNWILHKDRNTYHLVSWN